MAIQHGPNFYEDARNEHGTYPHGAPVKKSSAVPMILMGVIIALLVVGIAIFAGWALGSRGGSADTAEPVAVERVTETQTAAPAPVAAAPAAVPAGQSYSYAYAGSGNTSEAFADSVGAAFFSAYASSGTPNVTVNAYSPVTGKTYTMTCRDSGSYVTCTGGNNAVVYIS